MFFRVFPAVRFRRVILPCRPQRLYPQNLQHLQQKVRVGQKRASFTVRVCPRREKVIVLEDKNAKRLYVSTVSIKPRRNELVLLLTVTPDSY